MTLKCCALALVVSVTALNLFASETEMEVRYTGPAFETPRSEPVFFGERFDFAFSPRADRVFSDQFHPLKTLRRTSRFTSVEEFNDFGASRMRRALTKTFVDSLRESAVGLPFMSWLEERQEFVADLLRDSVASIEEESVSPLNIAYDAQERSWWRELRESGQMHYGIRPLRTSPYAYWGVGLKDGDKTVLLANTRYYYDHFKEHRFEIALSMPLAHGFGLDIGTSYQIGGKDDARKLVMKLFKELKAGGIVHLGFELRDAPMLFAGANFSW